MASAILFALAALGAVVAAALAFYGARAAWRWGRAAAAQARGAPGADCPVAFTDAPDWGGRRACFEVGDYPDFMAAVARQADERGDGGSASAAGAFLDGAACVGVRPGYRLTAYPAKRFGGPPLIDRAGPYEFRAGAPEYNKRVGSLRVTLTFSAAASRP